MGLSFSKSIRLGGGIRLNFSGAGIGIGAGIPGLRFGVGPRGFSVTASAGGFSYRATSPVNSRRSIEPRSSSAPGTTSLPPVDMQAIQSTNLEQLQDSDSVELVEELRRKDRLIRWWPSVPVLGVVASYGAFTAGWPLLYLGGLWGMVAVTTLWVAWIDRWRKTTVLFYELQGPALTDYADIISAAMIVASAHRKWRVVASGRVSDPKYHAGASQLLDKKVTFFDLRPHLRYIKTNVDVPCARSDSATLLFLPDMLIIKEGKGIGALSYQSIEVQSCDSRFIETGSVPADATVVDHTWKYVNKKGGPDKRFKDNRRYPICAYNALQLTSAGGLNAFLMFSKSQASAALTGALRRARQTGAFARAANSR